MVNRKISTAKFECSDASEALTMDKSRVHFDRLLVTFESDDGGKSVRNTDPFRVDGAATRR